MAFDPITFSKVGAVDKKVSTVNQEKPHNWIGSALSTWKTNEIGTTMNAKGDAIIMADWGENIHFQNADSHNVQLSSTHTSGWIVTVTERTRIEKIMHINYYRDETNGFRIINNSTGTTIYTQNTTSSSIWTWVDLTTPQILEPGEYRFEIYAINHRYRNNSVAVPVPQPPYNITSSLVVKQYYMSSDPTTPATASTTFVGVFARSIENNLEGHAISPLLENKNIKQWVDFIIKSKTPTNTSVLAEILDAQENVILSDVNSGSDLSTLGDQSIKVKLKLKRDSESDGTPEVNIVSVKSLTIANEPKAPDISLKKLVVSANVANFHDPNTMIDVQGSGYLLGLTISAQNVSLDVKVQIDDGPIYNIRTYGTTSANGFSSLGGLNMVPFTKSLKITTTSTSEFNRTAWVVLD